MKKSFSIISLFIFLFFTGCSEEQTTTFLEDNKSQEVTKTYKNVDESKVTSIQLVDENGSSSDLFEIGSKIGIKLNSYASSLDLDNNSNVINFVDKEVILATSETIDKIFENANSQELAKVELKIIAKELYYVGRIGLENISTAKKDFISELKIPSKLNSLQEGDRFTYANYIKNSDNSFKKFKVIVFDEINGKMKNIQVSNSFSLKTDYVSKIDINEFKTGLDGKNHAVLTSNYSELYTVLKPYINGLDSTKYDTSSLTKFLDENSSSQSSLYCKNGGHISTTFRLKQYNNKMKTMSYTPELYFNVGSSSSENWVKGLVPLGSDATSADSRASDFSAVSINLSNDNEMVQTISSCIPESSLKPLFDKYMTNLENGKVTIEIPTKLKIKLDSVKTDGNATQTYTESSVNNLEVIFTVPNGFNRKAYINKTPLTQTNKNKKAISRAINRSGTLDTGVSSKNLGIDFAGVKFDTTYDSSFVDTETTQKTTLNMVSGIYGHFGGATVPFFEKKYSIVNYPNNIKKNNLNVDTTSPLGMLFYSSGVGAFAVANSVANNAIAEVIANTVESVSAYDKFYFEISKTLVGLGKGEASFDIGVASGFEISLLEGITYPTSDAAGNSQEATFNRMTYTQETAASSGNYDAFKDTKKTIDAARDALSEAKKAFSKGLGAGTVSLLGLPIEFTAGMTVELGSGFDVENSQESIKLQGQLVYISAAGWGRGGLGFDGGALAVFAGVRGDIEVITLAYGHSAEINFDMEDDGHYRIISTQGKVGFEAKILKGKLSAIAELSVRLLFFSITIGASHTFIETPYLYDGGVVFFESEKYYVFEKGTNNWGEPSDNFVKNWMAIKNTKDLVSGDFEYVYSKNGKYKLSLDSEGKFYVVRAGDESMVGNILSADFPDPTNGLVINKTFDESSTSLDSLGNSFTHANTYIKNEGKKGKSGQFKNSYFRLNNFPSSFPNTSNGASHTITAWIKNSDFSGDQGIVAWGNSTNNGASVLQLRGGSLYSEWWYNDASASFSDTNTSKWKHVAITFDKDSETRALYINGQRVYNDTNTNPLSARLENFTIGAHNSLSRYFYGELDEVRVYNRSLSETEIKNVLNSGLEISKVRFNKNTRKIELFDKDGFSSSFCGTSNPITTDYVIALRDDGRLQIYAGTKDYDLKLMECDSQTTDNVYITYSDKLFPGEKIDNKRKIVSANGVFELKQHNGKVVIYQNDIDAPVWTNDSATFDFITHNGSNLNLDFASNNYYIQLFDDGKLVMYRGSDMDKVIDTIQLTYFDGVIKDFSQLNGSQVILYPGNTIFSKSKEYFLQVENEGNLKIYKSIEKTGNLSSDRKLVWDDNESVTDFKRILFEGPLLIKQPKKVKSVNLKVTNGYLELSDEGILRYYSSIENTTPVFLNNTGNPTNYTVFYQSTNIKTGCSNSGVKNYLHSGEKLERGKSICSSNKRYELKLDSNGRASLYDHAEDKEIWRPLSKNTQNDYLIALGHELILAKNTINNETKTLNDFRTISDFKESSYISWNLSLYKPGTLYEHIRYSFVLEDDGSIKLYANQYIDKSKYYEKKNEHNSIFASLVNVDGSYLNLATKSLYKGDKLVSDNNRYELINDFIEGIVIYDRKTDTFIKNLFSDIGSESSYIDPEGRFDIGSFIDSVYAKRNLTRSNTHFDNFYNIILELDDEGKVNLFEKETYDSQINRLWSNGTTSISDYDAFAIFDFDGKIEDKRGNLNVTVNGNPNFASGVSNKAVSLDGVDDFITIPSITIPRTYSISTWVKSNDKGSWGRVFDFGNGQHDHNVILTFNDNNCSSMSFYQIDGSYILRDERFDVTCNVWNHVVITQGDYKLKIYLNNKLIKEFDQNFEQRTLTSNFIGKSNWSDNSLRSVQIDEFSIYHKELTSSQIDELYKKAPKAIYKFDGNTNDEMGNLNGTFKSLFFYSPYANGLNDKSLYLSGLNNYVELGNMTFGKEYTVSSWVYNTANLNWDRIVDFGNGQNIDNIVLSYHSGCSNVSLYDHNLGKFVIASGLNCNQWNHIAATVDKTGIGKIYVNGVLQHTVQGNIRADSKTLTKNYIGKSNWSAQPYAKAYMDDIKIYDRALSEDEIKEAYIENKTFKSCKELLDAGFVKSGKYSINPTGTKDIDVYCDMTTDGGGWTLFASSATDKWFGGWSGKVGTAQHSWQNHSYSYGTYDATGGVSDYWRDFTSDKSPKEVLFKTKDSNYWFTLNIADVIQNKTSSFMVDYILDVNASSNNFGSDSCNTKANITFAWDSYWKATGAWVAPGDRKDASCTKKTLWGERGISNESFDFVKEHGGSQLFIRE